MTISPPTAISDVVAAGRGRGRTRRPAAGSRSRTSRPPSARATASAVSAYAAVRAVNSRSRSGAMRTAGASVRWRNSPVAPTAPRSSSTNDDRVAEVQRAALVRRSSRGWPARMLTKHRREHEQQRRGGEPERRARRAHLDELAGDEAAHGPSLRPAGRSSARGTPPRARSTAATARAAGRRPRTRSRRPARRRRRRRRARRPASRRRAAPRATSAVRSTSGRGVRTSTPAPAAVRLCTGPCWTSRPRWMTTTSSTVCATSARTWLETEHRAPLGRHRRAGSRAASGCPAGRGRWPGSSRTSTRGSPSSVAASPRRWRMPSEYLPARRSAALSSSTSRRTSSTRDAGSPAIAASARRWLRPERPGCAPATSRFAPTVRAGSSSST